MKMDRRSSSLLQSECAVVGGVAVRLKRTEAVRRRELVVADSVKGGRRKLVKSE